MPRALKSERFSLTKCAGGKRFIEQNGTHLISFNNRYEGGGDLTLQDLIDFARAKGVDASKILLPPRFITFAKL